MTVIRYSKLEAGCRVPLIVSWPGTIAPAVSDAAVSQIDFLVSLASLVGQPVPEGDSENAIEVLLGKSQKGHGAIVMEGINERHRYQGRGSSLYFICPFTWFPVDADFPLGSPARMILGNGPPGYSSQSHQKMR